MQLPVYTELSNFDTRAGGKRISRDISIVLILDSLSDPVNTINSIYQFVSKKNCRSEFILLNLNKEGYQYDKLLSTFPVMRVILPQEGIKLQDAIAIAAKESLSRNIFFLDENCRIESIQFKVLQMVFSESNFGVLLPLLVSEKTEVIPNIVKGKLKKGFIDTISMDIVGTAIVSLYPKYFCFVMNRDAFLSRNIELHNYEDSRYTLLELGYQFWKEGFIITQARNLKVLYSGETKEDIREDFSNKDYLFFHFANITSVEARKERWKRNVFALLKSFFGLNWKNISLLWDIFKNFKKMRENNLSKPIEDLAIFSIINKDIL
jgi:hypothetical protein